MGVKKYNNGTINLNNNMKQKIKKDPLEFDAKEEILDEFLSEQPI